MPEHPPESKNTLRSEHLNEGVSPIIACVGTPEQFKKNPGATKEVFQHKKEGYFRGIFQRIKTPPQKFHNIDYYGDPYALARQGIKGGGEFSYFMSPVDNLNKLSKEFKRCTGLVVTGKDKKTGENISFMSHQDPKSFLAEKNRDHFIDLLRQQLMKLKERSIAGTIDAVIVGGNWRKEDDYGRDYLESIQLLSVEVQKILGFTPMVMTGPKTTTEDEENVFYENEHRRLYIMRPRVGDGSTESFVPSDLENQEKKWK